MKIIKIFKLLKQMKMRITLKIESVIPASVRGILLLKLEESLLNSIEKGLHLA